MPWRDTSGHSWWDRSLFYLIRLVIFAGGFWLDEKQGVIELHVGIAELETIELARVLSVSGAKEVTSARAFDDGLFEDIAASEARQIQITKRVFPDTPWRAVVLCYWQAQSRPPER